MEYKIDEEMKKIEIPKDLHSRVVLGVNQSNFTKRKNYWVVGLVASLLIIASTYTWGGTYIANATDTLLNEIFGSKEKLIKSHPSEKGDGINKLENHLSLIEKTLTKEELADYSRLAKENVAIWDKIKSEKRDFANPEEEKRLEEIQAGLQKYEAKVSMLTTHTLEEAQEMVDYKLFRPSFVPEGYTLVKEEAHTEENNIGKNPVLSFEYQKGEFGYKVNQKNINTINPKDAVENWDWHERKSYQLKGLPFEYVSFNDSNVHGMKVSVPKEGYKITLLADIITKEEMEKVLLSMVTKK
jgi:hypothetical protein